MFAGKRRRSSNIRVMQLFHEIKQKFPTIPDHLITSCITAYVQSNTEDGNAKLIEYVEKTLAKTDLDPMGRPSPKFESPLLSKEIAPNLENSQTHSQELVSISAKATPTERNKLEMKESATEVNRNSKEPSVTHCNETIPKSVAKRPTHLDIRSEILDNNFNITSDDKKNFNIRPSEKCKDLYKLLNSNNIVSDKPPRSPLSSKRFVTKNSPTKIEKSSLASPSASSGTDSSKKLQEETNKCHEELKRCGQDKSTEFRTPIPLLSDAPRELIQRNDESLGAVKKRHWSIQGSPQISPTETKKENSFSNFTQETVKSPDRSPSDIKKEISGSDSFRELSQRNGDSLGAVKKRLSPIHSPTDLQKDIVSPNQRGDNLNKDSLCIIKKDTCSTPTQTTDTLLMSPNLNLSLNVNLDVLQSPTIPPPRRTSVIELTPSQPWLQSPCTSSKSPRSFTSVNLTLRSPTSAPQEPIDITSHNSTLTYSTSSFDPQKGLGSRLQITVGPGGGSNVQSLRVRPRSYHPQDHQESESVPARAASLDDLAVTSQAPVILKQRARLERLRSELNNEKIRLDKVKQEVEDLEKKRLAIEYRIDLVMEKQLVMEINHLRSQCKDLELDSDEFYQNIYTGPQVTYNPPPSPRRRRLQYQSPPPIIPEYEGPAWNCGVCTFINHPDLDKCEQCEMPRIVHGTRYEAINPNVTFDTLQALNNIDFGYAASRSFSLDSVPDMSNPITERPIGFVLDQSGQVMSLPPHIIPSHSTPNMALRGYLKK